MNNEYFDNKEDRREIYKLLQHLNEQKREAFLLWCCKEVNQLDIFPNKKSTWHEKEVFWQLMQLAYVHQLDLKKAYLKLESFVRKGFLY